MTSPGSGFGGLCTLARDATQNTQFDSGLFWEIGEEINGLLNRSLSRIRPDGDVDRTPAPRRDGQREVLREYTGALRFRPRIVIFRSEAFVSPNLTTGR